MTLRAPWWALAAALVVLLALPALVPVFWMRLATETLMWACIALSWNLIGGYTGYLNFGLAAFFGVGAYATGILMYKAGLPFGVALPLAGVVGGLLALFLGLPTLRIRGAVLRDRHLGLRRGHAPDRAAGRAAHRRQRGPALPSRRRQPHLLLPDAGAVRGDAARAARPAPPQQDRLLARRDPRARRGRDRDGDRRLPGQAARLHAERHRAGAGRRHLRLLDHDHQPERGVQLAGQRQRRR